MSNLDKVNWVTQLSSVRINQDDEGTVRNVEGHLLEAVLGSTQWEVNLTKRRVERLRMSYLAKLDKTPALKAAEQAIDDELWELKQEFSH
jgi:hypothetical protein